MPPKWPVYGHFLKLTIFKSLHLAPLLLPIWGHFGQNRSFWPQNDQMPKINQNDQFWSKIPRIRGSKGSKWAFLKRPILNLLKNGHFWTNFWFKSPKFPKPFKLTQFEPRWVKIPSRSEPRGPLSPRGVFFLIIDFSVAGLKSSSRRLQSEFLAFLFLFCPKFLN